MKRLGKLFVATAITMAIVVAIVALFSGCGKFKGNKGGPGPAGPQGVPGNVGPSGTPGIDATPVTAIQFCDGTPVYPSSFPESGICINHVLYGVFWMGGAAWLAALPPGQYVSTTTAGDACAFTVGDDCQVTR